jgi:hypothetical protein
MSHSQLLKCTVKNKWMNSCLGDAREISWYPGHPVDETAAEIKVQGSPLPTQSKLKKDYE